MFANRTTSFFGGPSLSLKYFALNWGAHKVLLTQHRYCCYPWKCRAPGLPAAKVPGLRAGDLSTSQPPTSAGQAVPTAALEREEPWLREPEGCKPPVSVLVRKQLCFTWRFHLSWTVSLHFLEGQAVSCRTFCCYRVVVFLKRRRQSPRTVFCLLHHMRRCKWTNSQSTLTQCIDVA